MSGQVVEVRVRAADASPPRGVADVGAALHEVLAASMRAWAGQFRRLAVLGGAKWDR